MLEFHCPKLTILGGNVATLEPRVNFAELSDADIAKAGLDAGEAAFWRIVEHGLTVGDSLILLVGYTERGGEWYELGQRGFGPDADDFVVNVDAETGKLSTAIEYGVDSVDAYAEYDDEIPAGPRRFTGGVYYVARVKTEQLGWVTRHFAGAASGVQGHFDMAIVYAALTHMGALWALKMQALHGRAA